MANLLGGLCGKVCHYTRSTAREHAASLKRDGLNNKPGRLRPYWCWCCQAYHVGHGHRRKGVGLG